jgi:hypothetical protein
VGGKPSTDIAAIRDTKKKKRISRTGDRDGSPMLQRTNRCAPGRPSQCEVRWAARTAAGRQRSGDIRAWAKEHGIAVRDRGRIPASVVERYQAAAKGR